MNSVQELILSLSELDYESMGSISTELNLALGFELDDIQFKREVNNLFEQGQLNIFSYNQASTKFDKLREVKLKDIPNIWFMAKQ